MVAKSAEKIVVEIMNGADDGRLIECRSLSISIGRASDNVVSLPYDHLVSRYHARVVKAQDRFMLCDLDSTNGTFVGKRRIREDTPIEPSKLFRIGATLMLLRSTEK